MKIISPKLHGIIDYLSVIFLFASPTLFVMTDDIAQYTYALAFACLLLTILTNYSYGLFRMIPLQLHGLIELLMGIGLVVVSYTLLRYDERAKPFYLFFGIFVLIVFAFTDYNKKHDVATAPTL